MTSANVHQGIQELKEAWSALGWFIKLFIPSEFSNLLEHYPETYNTKSAFSVYEYILDTKWTRKNLFRPFVSWLFADLPFFTNPLINTLATFKFRSPLTASSFQYAVGLDYPRPLNRVNHELTDLRAHQFSDKEIITDQKEDLFFYANHNQIASHPNPPDVAKFHALRETRYSNLKEEDCTFVLQSASPNSMANLLSDLILKGIYTPQNAEMMRTALKSITNFRPQDLRDFAPLLEWFKNTSLFNLENCELLITAINTSQLYNVRSGLEKLDDFELLAGPQAQKNFNAILESLHPNSTLFALNLIEKIKPSDSQSFFDTIIPHAGELFAHGLQSLWLNAEVTQTDLERLVNLTSDRTGGVIKFLLTQPKVLQSAQEYSTELFRYALDGMDFDEKILDLFYQQLGPPKGDVCWKPTECSRLEKAITRNNPNSNSLRRVESQTSVTSPDGFFNDTSASSGSTETGSSFELKN